jgi:uncharacterized protein
MLVSARFKNLFSFDGEETISFVAGKTQNHKDHVAAGSGRGDPSILKSALIYGANASGKSNLIKCFSVVRRMILKGTRPDERIKRVPFKLRKAAINEPSSFEIVIKVDSDKYAYSVSFTDREIVAEKLTLVGKTAEKDLFQRSNTEGKDQIIPGTFLKKAADRKFFEFIARGTRPNQLFLTESVERNSPWLKPIHQWARDKLIIIYPETWRDAFEQLVRPNNRLHDDYHTFFEMLGLGIDGVEVRELDPVADRGLVPEKVVQAITRDLPSGNSVTIFNTSNGRFRFIRESTGDLKGYKLVMKHKACDGAEAVDFDVNEESDGTRRLLDLIPILVDLTEQDRVVLIDEIDRSMHPQLSRAFFEFFFFNSSPRSQILATTHDLDLMDLDLFRKDEIWFVEKDTRSASHVYSLEEFKPRFDKDIRKGYVQGRFGAIPIVKNIKGALWGK